MSAGYKWVKRRVWERPPLCVQMSLLESITDIYASVAKIEAAGVSSKTMKRVRRAAKKRIAELKLRAF